MSNFKAYFGDWLKALEDIKSLNGIDVIVKDSVVQLLSPSVEAGVSHICTFVGTKGTYEFTGKEWEPVEIPEIEKARLKHANRSHAHHTPGPILTHEDIRALAKWLGHKTVTINCGQPDKKVKV